MAVTMLADAGGEMADQWLSLHAGGEAVLTVAWQEEGQRYNTQPTLTELVSSDGGFSLTGIKREVWHAAGSDALLVTAVHEGEMAIVLVPTQAPGVTLADFPTFDMSRCATATFEKVALDANALLAKGKAAEEIFAKGLDYGITALCAHACGAMQYLIEVTMNYLKTRQQFGQPLINFQVLQHRLADMLIQQEMAMSNAFVAAAALADPSPAVRSKRVSMAKTEVAMAARKVGEEAVQLHGGMGVTDELEVGDYFKRLAYIGVLLGDNNFHLQRAQSLAVA